MVLVITAFSNKTHDSVTLINTEIPGIHSNIRSRTKTTFWGIQNILSTLHLIRIRSGIETILNGWKQNAWRKGFTHVPSSLTVQHKHQNSCLDIICHLSITDLPFIHYLPVIVSKLSETHGVVSVGSSKKEVVMFCSNVVIAVRVGRASCPIWKGHKRLQIAS